MRSLKYIIGISVLIIIVCLIISFLIIPSMANVSEVEDQTNSIPISTTLNLLKESSFTARAERDKIVIYRTGETTPYKKTDIVVSSLPIADQHSLEAGVFLQDEQSLKKFLRDFSG